ncbi:aminodeoxychorismate synthase component I [Blautia sp. 2744]|uniref:Anthranilate synthase component 1 n=2 Tax=Blautia TaxID=572511 RepID=A0A414EH64_9FIRM|nr:MULTISPECIES: aminodeoxychorismate synthase component I [Blautia]MBC5740088.1 aminodeoxychorismate synthase component I [Blautia intestinalis]RHD30846.1 aminodeoxychorismate synthase component I [Blautia obeum]RHE38402.1 aminodeoxychorismate synthase component I [Blautia obeum]
MYNKRRIIKEMKPARGAAELYTYFAGTDDSVFLDSSLVNKLGRYSVIGAVPYLKLVKEGNNFYINGEKETTCSFETYLKTYLAEHKDKNNTELPIISGAIGYFSYEYGRKLMEVDSVKEDLVSIPDAVLVFYDFYIIEDRHEQRTYLIANGITREAAKLLDEMESRINGKPVYMQKESDTEYPIEVQPNFAKDEYKQAVDRMIRYIIEGDIYITNMTQQLTVKSDKVPLDVFYDLRENNPSPFGGYFDYGDFQIVCASPERFLKMQKGHVNTRPIKGTRKRGETPEEDMFMRTELENSEKDKSELLMIVDLERNDLNRVCRPGSVKVTELFSVEEYATVFHLVSDIEGDLEESKNVMDLLEAAFPGGSITGAPKYRAMEIIDELENNKRNLYTGSIGYLTLDGGCDFNIVIRTALYKDGKYYLGVGGGITAESDLEFEYEETLQKAKAVLLAMR